MNFTINHFLYWVAAYLVGAIPFGWIIVKVLKNKDIRYIGSGRMGMSNVMRVAGTFWAIVTAVLDVLKGYAAVKMAPLFVPEPEPWLTSIGGILAVLGHIYSIFLIEKRRDGKYYFRGGAGGLTSAGAAVALWRGFWFAMPLPCLLIYLVTGYASVTVACFNIFGFIGFLIGAIMGKCSWWYLLFAVGAELLVLISLQPNFKRLRRGDERKSKLRIRWRIEDRENNKSKENPA